MKEHGLLEDFLKTHPYAITKKYSNLAKVSNEPLTNYLDVSGSAPLPLLLTQSVMDAPSRPLPLSHFEESWSPVDCGGHLPAPQ